ncbi:uracil-DNA glycosylase [Candidatus Odyssella thessalonicensis]|uniref:uracil-DNA glycosylase n=1 Tax=Candidatus Odyssella thessalonicensis TaxID=84647 RepID=UPI000225AC64|nr:uracil-DNA glycosylase [Candidatus Odyssella thessalonicensis]
MKDKHNNSASNPISDILEWYTDIGMTVAIGDQPVNHKQARPKPSPVTVAAAPITRAHVEPLPEKPAHTKQASNSKAIAAACQTLEELRQAVLNFDGCDLKATATNTVFCDGSPEAKIMVIGEAPGADEDRQGRPFVGVSGQLLDRALQTIGLSRQDNVYITNIINWRPPGNRTPTPHEMAICQPFVERHIELVAPKILVLVGGTSTKTILNTNEGIMKIRGRWHEFKTERMQEPIKTLATYHPAFLLRSPGQKATVWRDLLMIEDELMRLGLK